MNFYPKILKSMVTSAILGGNLLLTAGQAFAADTYVIDSVHSHAQFKIKHLNVGYQYGRFNDIEGTVIFDDKNPAQSKVNITIKTASVDTKNAKRDEHLRSPDFFNAKQFPSLSFKSSHIKKLSANNYQVTGTLNLHGISKTVSFNFQKTGEGKDPWGQYRMGGETNFSINRTDYGINFMPDGLGKEVMLMLSFEGVKK